MNTPSQKRKCKFTEIAQSKFPCFVKGKDDYTAKCVICDSSLDVSGKGTVALERHVATEKHKQCVRQSASSSKMTNFFASSVTPVSKKSNAAAGTLAFHTVKHHQSYKSNDCTARLMAVMFNDSETAKNFKCARTKTEAIVNNVLAPHTLATVRDKLQTIKFVSVATDASNHKCEKMFPIVIQYFDWTSNGIENKIIELKSLPDEKLETVAEYVVTALNNFQREAKVVAFVGDNANVNFGGINRRAGNNVFTHLKAHLKNEGLVGIGCPAHIVHNSLHHGTDQLSIDIETIILKIFNYFSIYTVRTEALKSFCEYVEINYQPLLNHSKTRWLSLFPAIERLLKLFPSVKDYFDSIEQPPKSIASFFANPYSEAYLWFAHSLMHAFHTSMATVEREQNSLLEVSRSLVDLMSLLDNRLRDHFLPMKVKQLLSKINDPIKSRAVTAEFFEVYRSSLNYIQKWVSPLKEFQPFEWLTLSDATNLKFSNIEACVQMLRNKNIDIDDVKLFDQFCRLIEFVKHQSDDFHEKSSNEKWTLFFKANSLIDHHSELLTIAEYFFSISAHNANVERIFSFINSQWTKERGRLLIDSVRAITLTQYNNKDICCSDFHTYLMKNEKLLEQIAQSEKYN